MWLCGSSNYFCNGVVTMQYSMAVVILKKKPCESESSNISNTWRRKYISSSNNGVQVVTMYLWKPSNIV